MRGPFVHGLQSSRVTPSAQKRQARVGSRRGFRHPQFVCVPHGVFKSMTLSSWHAVQLEAGSMFGFAHAVQSGDTTPGWMQEVHAGGSNLGFGHGTGQSVM